MAENGRIEPRKVIRTIWARIPVNSSSSSSSPSLACRKSGEDQSSARFLMQNQEKFRRSGSPARFMFFDDGSWVDFSREVLECLRLGFSEKKTVIEVAIHGSNYVFDFLRMLQIDSTTGKQRSIAWIDERNDCFFPREFVGDEVVKGSDKNLRIEIEIQISGEKERKLSKRGRKMEESNEEENEVTSSLKLKDEVKRQRVGDSGSETPKWPNVRLLGEGDGAYKVIENVFLTGIKKIDAGATITAIHQCLRIGSMEISRARRCVFQKQMEITKAARGTSNMVYAWYGASAKHVSSVLTYGFGVPSKVSGSDAHGVGVYLSPLGLPHLSAGRSEADDNGEKHLILCRVILGNVEKVDAGSQQGHPSSVIFDTGADDPKNPKCYVVWPSNMSRHILPECVVSYKSSDCFRAETGRFAHSKYSFPELFSKIKGSLPPFKVLEAKNLYEALRAGKMAKDLFIKQFRLLAGEKVLLSAIREICGVH